jgi:magnesium transporter
MDDLEAESQTGRIDDLLKEKLEKAFHKQTSKVRLHDIAKIACEHSPIDLAYAASHLPPNVRPVLYENLPNRDDKIKFIVNTDSDTRLTLFRQLDDVELKKIFERMPTDEAVWVVDDMPERRFRRLMDLIDSKKANRIRELKKHDRKSAGRLMTSEFFAFTMDMTIGEAAAYIRDNPRIDFTKGIFILNHTGELQGFVPARNMMINPNTTPLRQVMRPVLHKVMVDATREEVIDIVERYKISSLPVVDIDNELIGVISHDDIVEAMEDLADETIARMAGTNEKFTSHDPILRRFLTRAPWLLVTLLAGLINVGVMSSFQKHEGGFLTFALFFVPLITGMSGEYWSAVQYGTRQNYGCWRPFRREPQRYHC